MRTRAMTSPVAAAAVLAIMTAAVASGCGGEGRAAGDGRGVTPGGASREVRKGTRPAYFPEGGGPVETPVYDRYALRPGDRFPGPAIVEERESTAVVGPGGWFEIDGEANLVMIRATDDAPARSELAAERPRR